MSALQPLTQPSTTEAADSLQALAPSPNSVKNSVASEERRAVQALQQQAMQAALATAQGRGEQYWNLNDYLNALGSDAIQAQWQEALAQGTITQPFDTNALKAMLDFKDQTVEHFAIERSTIPSTHQTTEEKNALLAAWEDPENQGIQNLKAMMAIEEAEETFFDCDGNETINPFYLSIESALNLKESVLKHCYTHPAGTYDDVARGASCEDMTFKGIGENEEVYLRGGGSFTNIRFEDAKNGTLVIDAAVQGLNLSGVCANLTLGPNAYVQGVEVDERTRILTLHGEEGAVLSHAHFGKEHIGMASELRGVTFDHVTFHETGLHQIPFAGAILQNVTFDGMDASELNLAGATLKGTITLENIRNPEALDLADLTLAESSALVINGQRLTQDVLERRYANAPSPMMNMAAASIATAAEADPATAADRALKAQLNDQMAALGFNPTFDFKHDPNARWDKQFETLRDQGIGRA